MKILLVGFGNMGQKHAKKLVQLGGIEPAIVYRPNQPPLSNYEKHGELVLDAFNYFNKDPPLFKSLEKAIAEFKPDAAIVATPTLRHFSDAKLLLEARIPTLVEKPLTLTLAQDTELQALAHRLDTPLIVGYTERFNPAVTEFLNTYLPLLDGLHTITTTRTSAMDKPEHPFVDLGVHDMDLVLQILQRLSPSQANAAPPSVSIAASHIVDGIRPVKAKAHIVFGSNSSHPQLLFDLNLLSTAYTSSLNPSVRVMYFEDARGELKIDFAKKQILEKVGVNQKIIFESKDDSLLQEHLFFQTVIKEGLSAQNPGPFDPWLFNLGTQAKQIMSEAATQAMA